MVNSGLEREREREGGKQKGRETMQSQAPALPQRTELRQEAGTQAKNLCMDTIFLCSGVFTVAFGHKVTGATAGFSICWTGPFL